MGNGSDTPIKPGETLSDKLYIETYSALRGEITQRIGTRNQLLSLTLTLAGVFLGAGVQDLVRPSVLLVYPILATFLAAAWTHSDVRVGQIGEYIKDNFESRLSGVEGWEQYILSKHACPKRRGHFSRWFESWLISHLVEVYAIGTFLTTQILIFLLAVLHPNFSISVTEVILFIFDAAGFALTVALVSLRRKRYRGR